MRMFRPIPRAALPDVMTVRLAAADGGFGEPVVVAGVRFDEAQRESGDEHRSADNGSGVVFVDAVNTAGAFEVPVGARVSVRGRSYIVKECHRCEDLFGRCHHWELKVG
ncbi:MAG: minor capsid protein [Eggerthellaceae bacterium]|nr:minor capsid protein [Eggerthellaceae bacterium]